MGEKLIKNSLVTIAAIVLLELKKMKKKLPKNSLVTIVASVLYVVVVVKGHLVGVGDCMKNS